jgi:hypothetical protein
MISIDAHDRKNIAYGQIEHSDRTYFPNALRLK